MEAHEICVICREELGLRIGPAMAQYVFENIEAGDSTRVIPVIGGDARTGLPQLREIPLMSFTTECHP